MYFHILSQQGGYGGGVDTTGAMTVGSVDLIASDNADVIADPGVVIFRFIIPIRIGA